MAEGRVEQEKKVVEKMIKIWCAGQKHGGVLCPECRELLEYSYKRLDLCKFGEHKTFCSRCPVHCYKPDMREKIRAVMRYSGPRMIFHHPILALRHMLEK